MDYCTPGVCTEGCLGVIEIVMFVFKVFALPRIFVAPGCKVGVHRTVLKANARYDGIDGKVELIYLKRD